jgi:hypothetical protein
MARNAGADTVAGTSLPPDWIANVAGTRTFVEPPLLFDFLWVEPPPTPAPPLGGLVVVDACVVVEAVVVGLVLDDWLVVEDEAACVDVDASVDA